MKTAIYSLITMKPSLERLDVLCIGVAVISETEWTICTLQDAKKFQSLDSTFKLSAVTNLVPFLKSLFADFSTMKEARDCLASNRSSICLHDFEGVFGYTTNDDFQNQISGIMAESVRPKAAITDKALTSRISKPRIRSRLRKQFQTMGILGKTGDDINSHKVVPNFPVSLKYGLVAEFALKNGVMSFTETLDFDVAEDAVRNRIFEAQAKCLVMKTAVAEFGDAIGRHIVIAGGNINRASRSIDLLSSVGTIYALESSSDMKNYFEAMDKSASHIG